MPTRPSPSAEARRLPAAARRRQLLDVALDQFASSGFHATAMDDIAEAAGVTKPVLYQHFASKRALYLELLGDVGDRLIDAIALATREAGSPREQVAAGFEAYVGVVANQHNAFRLLFGSGARRDEQFAEAVSRTEEAIAGQIARLIEADVSPSHRQTLAWAIVGMSEGVIRRWIDDPQRPSPATLSRELSDLAWGGLRGVSRID
ncbi:MAG: TetR/AcrR family transcriptional regulator [Acidimicrobiales bacterium]